jgi:transcriptional regulator with XRE-family HTH domain
MNLGQTAKLMRTASGLGQKEIAEQLGVTVNYMSLVENGKREPSLPFLRRLARVLHVPVGLFFLWENHGPRSSQRGFSQLLETVTKLEAMYLVAKRQKGSKRLERSAAL